MVKVDLKGIKKKRAKGHIYYYAWEGGPRLRGEPGSPEFIASYNEAIEQRRTPDTRRFRFVVTDYKASGDYKKLADSTRDQWGKWLDRIAEYFGDLSIAQFDRPEKIRPVIRRWRNKWSETPRTADYALQVLSRVVAHAVDPLGKIAGNPCEGIKHLYNNAVQKSSGPISMSRLSSRRARPRSPTPSISPVTPACGWVIWCSCPGRMSATTRSC
jgi:hypothetical protein